MPTPAERQKYDFGSMEVGDWKEFALWENQKSAINSAYSYGKRHGLVFARRNHEDVIRIWRLK